MQNTQRLVSRLIVQAGQMLLSHGAESALVADIMHRIGLASGADEVEVALTPNAIVITTLFDSKCMTTTRQIADRGINMRVITQIQHICIEMETKNLSFTDAQQKLNAIVPVRYNRWLVVFMIGLSCAAFSRLAGGDMSIFLVTFVAASAGMVVRQEIGHRQFNPMINFTATAFVTSLISSQAVVYNLGNQPFIAMASSVLMLVPGVPLINAVADMVKGYVSMGIARFVIASMLTFSTCLGIIGAMRLVNIWGWPG